MPEPADALCPACDKLLRDCECPEPGEFNSYNLQWFQLMTYFGTRYVIYGFGHWTGHIMDWAGCNFHHGRLPGSPIFDTTRDAIRWLRQRIAAKRYWEGMEMGGHHAGDLRCSKGCDQRIVGDVFFERLAEGWQPHVPGGNVPD